MASSNSHSKGQGSNDQSLKQNKALVEKALENYTLPALTPFIQQKMEAKYGRDWLQKVDLGLKSFHIKDGELNWNDSQAVLKIMLKQWHPVFLDELGYSSRGLANELLDLRNAIKHNDLSLFDDDSVFRALDSMSRLLHQIASESAREVELIKTEFRKKWHSEDRLTKTPDFHAFQSLVAEKTEDFVGREFVFQAIQTFLEAQPNGYFILEADPGMGKTAILAEYFRRNHCIVHFNIRSQGMNKADQFLESVCAQLIEQYRLPYDSLPSDAIRDGKFLSKLLDEVSVSLKPNQRLIIAIDALDEVDVSDHPGGNLLYLPITLPKNVYFVLTQRPILLSLSVNSPLQRFKLMQYRSESEKDIQFYLQSRINKSDRLQTWISENQSSPADFASNLALKSENNFMYLRYVLREIENGSYRNIDLDSLPQGLEAYYEDHWRRMGMNATPAPRNKLKIVYILAELQPVSRALISDFAQEDTLTVQDVLDQWREYLREEEVDRQTCYSIYHTSFSDFLYRKDIVQAAGDLLTKLRQQIADDLLKGLYDS